MINWLINFLNQNGYYFNVSRRYNYYENIGSAYNYELQPNRRMARRRGNRRSKKKLAAKNANTRIKISEVKGIENDKFLTKISGGVQKPSILKKTSGQQGFDVGSKTKSTLNENLIKSEIKAAEEVQLQVTPEEKVLKKEYKTEVEEAAPIMQPNYTFKYLREAFRSEIRLIQARLVTEAALQSDHDDNDLIVAEIKIENKTETSDVILEFIRTELIGWIGAYQEQGMNTPIFHSIVKKKCNINIVCDNKYAYECVARCIADLNQMKTIGALKVHALPPITPLIYCFDATYEGIASDPDLFLTQLHLHKSKLYTKDWLVASHEFCSEQRKTYFVFLLDERSALALNFRYNRSFYICMQKVTFHNRGIVVKTI